MFLDMVMKEYIKERQISKKLFQDINFSD